MNRIKESSGYDDIKIQVIDRFREQDPMTLSSSELRSAIDYMLAYRWALNGDEDVLHDYIEASKLRNKNESKNMNKKLIRLTESDLHKIVKESVKSALREVYYIDYDMVTQYPHKNFREAEPPIEDFYDADDYYAKPIEHPDDPNRQWDAYNRRNQFMKDVAYDAMTYHPHYVDNDNGFNKDSRKYAKSYAKGEPYDFANNGGGRIAAGVRGKALNDFNKQWQDQEDREKYSKMADSRPLYRKNSPNKDIPR